MLVALCSDKGSPGVTTAALALAAAWPEPATVVEGDAAGGDLALRVRPKGTALSEAPTILSVLTAARSHQGEDPVGEHSHVLNSTTVVVPGAVLAEQMSRVGDWLPLADALARGDRVTFFDAGHLRADSPTLPVVARAELVIAVGRPDVGSIIRLRERLVHLAGDLAPLRGGPPQLMALLITASRHARADIRDLLAVLIETSAKPFLVDAGFLAHDPDAVRRLEAGDEPTGRLARTDLMRSARTVIDQIAAAISAPNPASAAVRVGER